MRRQATNSGKNLNHQWSVGAKHTLYREDGKWYMSLNQFPGAFFDANGYVLYKTQADYERCPYLSIGERVNVQGGISSLPHYKKMTKG